MFQTQKSRASYGFGPGRAGLGWGSTPLGQGPTWALIIALCRALPFMMAHEGQQGVLFLPLAFHANTWKSGGYQNSTIVPNETCANKDYFDKVVQTESCPM